MLRKAGADVLVASDGRKAVELLQANPAVALVLMDCHMPDVDGFAATRIIRSDVKFSHVPVLALTASVFPDDLAACRAAGMNDHIEKPFEMVHFFKVLHQWLQPGSVDMVARAEHDPTEFGGSGTPAT